MWNKNYKKLCYFNIKSCVAEVVGSSDIHKQSQ